MREEKSSSCSFLFLSRSSHHYKTFTETNMADTIVGNVFLFYFILFERDVPMTPYNHLRSQHCNASWRGQFMYIAQLAPYTTFNT